MLSSARRATRYRADDPQNRATLGYVLLLAFRDSIASVLQDLWRKLGCAVPFAGLGSIAGVPAGVLKLRDRVLLSLSGAEGDPFEVTARDVANAEALEQALPVLRSRAIEPPVDSRPRVCPKYCPEVWPVGGPSP